MKNDVNITYPVMGIQQNMQNIIQDYLSKRKYIQVHIDYLIE